ncbi:MAG: YicC/YloC family endoribonuclease [Myxococcota bacterium]
MIRSMTGFGRADFAVGELAFEVEVRSVNHRYLDVRAKLPRVLARCEARAVAAVQAHLQRGKVDMTISHASSSAAPARLEIDREAAGQYVEAARELALRFHLSNELDVATLLALPGVTRLTEPELAEDELERALDDGVARALAALDAMREREGTALASELDGRLERVAALAGELESRSDVVREAVRERLRRRARQLEQDTGLLDEARLHQEIVLAADRLDITEEVVRLRSHVDQFRAIVAEAGRATPVGRRLDFLLQEMGREANTTGSKANDAELAHFVVELKTELERVREQVQNVE